MRRDQLEFLTQYVMQKNTKIAWMRQRLEETKSKLQRNQTSNKVALEEQLLKEKELKFRSILAFALSAIGNVTCNRRAIQSPVAPGSAQFLHSEAGATSRGSGSYFYFSGSQSGLQYNGGGLTRGPSDPQPRLATQPGAQGAAGASTAWPFQKGYTLAISFKCLIFSGSGGPPSPHGTQGEVIQAFDPNNLPVLFNCFAEGYGGFECYLNPNYQVIYRVLPRSYSPPTVSSNGVKVADVQTE